MTPEISALLDTMLTELHGLHNQPEKQKEQVAKINALLEEQNIPKNNLISIAINNALNNN